MALPPLDYQPRRSIDWRQAARLWRAGVDPGDVAALIGIDPDYLWRHVERSPRFRRWLFDSMAIQPACKDRLVNLVRNKQK